MTTTRGAVPLPRDSWLLGRCRKCMERFALVQLQRTNSGERVCIHCWSHDVEWTWGSIWVEDNGDLSFVPEKGQGDG
jgi:hypothetical protein